jgi:hypothetical protein
MIFRVYQGKNIYIYMLGVKLIISIKFTVQKSKIKLEIMLKLRGCNIR